MAFIPEGVALGISLAMTAAAAAVSAVGAIQQGAAASAMGKYNQSVAAANAETARTAAAAQAGQIDRQNAQQMGAVAAAYGAASLDTQGTPLLVMSDLKRQGALKQALATWQGETQAAADLNQGQQAGMQAKAAQTASYYTAGSTLLTGLGRAAGSFYSPTGAGTSPVVP